MLNIGVFDDHWTTLGGGEKLAAAYASALRGMGRVELLGVEHVEPDVIAERLHVDLDGVSFRTAPDDVSSVSAEYDVFVNCSFGSKLASRARRSVYVVHFPERPGDLPTEESIALMRSPALETPGAITWGEGFYPAESEPGRTYRWMQDRAELWVDPYDVRDTGRAWPLVIEVTAEHRPPGLAPILHVESGGSQRTVDLEPTGPTMVAVEVAAREPVVLSAEGFHVEGDPRRFAMQVLSARYGPPRNEELSGRLANQNHVRSTFSFLDTYDALLANSGFTARAVDRFWNRQAQVVYPAVSPRVRGSKKARILSVGRFFGEAGGHSKRQMVLVEAFRALVERGLCPGWELVLVGGATPGDPYADYVRAASRGLPVRVITDASRGEIDRAYAEASIYWHATGLGLDPVRHPELFEHFGISIVEAMSAAAVPIVPVHGGPAEIVVDGVSGFHVDSTAELIAATEWLAKDPSLRRTMADGAARRAEDFSDHRFTAAVSAAVTGLVSAS